MSLHGLIVIGSGPAGVSAAESFRESNDQLPITIYTTDPDRPYARPPLSKQYLRGETNDIEFATVGVLTYNADEDYELGEHLIQEGKPPPLGAR